MRAGSLLGVNAASIQGTRPRVIRLPVRLFASTRRKLLLLLLPAHTSSIGREREAHHPPNLRARMMGPPLSEARNNASSCAPASVGPTETLYVPPPIHVPQSWECRPASAPAPPLQLLCLLCERKRASGGQYAHRSVCLLP